MIAGIVLAAGASSRLGRPKQLLPYRGRPLTQHAIDAALAARLHEVIVVLGYEAEAVLAGLDLKPPARAVINRDYLTGQASSLRAGLRAAGADVQAAIVLLGDQPGVSADTLRAVIAAYERSGGPVVRTTYAGQPGHPVLFDRGVWGDVEAIEGDVGARELLARHPEWVVTVPAAEPPPIDVDTWADYEELTGAAGSSSAEV